MPKLISAADPVPTLLAMVMLDRRLSLTAACAHQGADGPSGTDGLSSLLDAFLDAREAAEDRHAPYSREATA